MQRLLLMKNASFSTSRILTVSTTGVISYFNLYVLFFHILPFFNTYNYSKVLILSKKNSEKVFTISQLTSFKKQIICHICVLGMGKLLRMLKNTEKQGRGQFGRTKTPSITGLCLPREDECILLASMGCSRVKSLKSRT